MCCPITGLLQQQGITDCLRGWKAVHTDLAIGRHKSLDTGRIQIISHRFSSRGSRRHGSRGGRWAGPGGRSLLCRTAGAKGWGGKESQFVWNVRGLTSGEVGWVPNGHRCPGKMDGGCWHLSRVWNSELWGLSLVTMCQRDSSHTQGGDSAGTLWG